MVTGVKRSIFYFDSPGPLNTERTIELAKKRAVELEIKHVVVASLTGTSAVEVAKKMRDVSVKVVCVTFRAGPVYNVKSLRSQRHWKEIPELANILEQWNKQGLRMIQGPNNQTRRTLGELGVTVVTATDLAYNIDASLAQSFGLKTHVKIIEGAFRFLMCPGFKVCIFTTMTAADAGAVSVDEEVVSLGGTEQGLDTALVIKPSYSDEVFHHKRGLEIREIICKPRTMMGPSGFYFERGQ